MSNDELTISDWRKSVKERDKACQVCGSDDRINAHHILARCLGGKNTLDNGKTLCWTCHRKAHLSDKHLWPKPSYERERMPPRVEINIFIDPDLKAAAQRKAKVNGLNMNFVVKKILEDWVNDLPNPGPKV